MGGIVKMDVKEISVNVRSLIDLTHDRDYRRATVRHMPGVGWCAMVRGTGRGMHDPLLSEKRKPRPTR